MAKKQNGTKKPKFSTTREVDSLKPINDKQTDYCHKNLPGFMLRVGPRGKKWIVRYYLDGKLKTHTLRKPYPDLSLEDATNEYKRIRGKALDGEDPQAKRAQRKKAPTVADIIKEYFKETPLLAKGKKESERIANKDIIPTIGHIKAMDLKRQHVKDIHRSIVDREAPVMANRVVEFLRRVFNHAFEEELIEENKFPSIKKFKEEEYSRERKLSDEEIRTIWPALDTLSDNMRDIHKLLLLLGQRTQDICSMKIEDIDTEKKTWTVPAPKRGKNKKPNPLPLPPMAWAIIEPRLEKHDQWVFPSKYNTTRKGYTGGGHSTSTKNARLKLIELTGVTGWTGHDLRRTMRSLLSEEVPPHIAERVLGHVQTGIIEVYDRHDYSREKGQALVKLEKKIRKIVGMEQEQTKIIPLKQLHN